MIRRAKEEKAKIWAHHARTPLRRRLLRGSALTASLLAVALSASVERAYANPQGGTVVVGDATINPIDDTTLEINQGSDRIVIDWTSFSIDADETVAFLQPDFSSVALNRVTGFDQSFINGVLSANGYVFLVNPNGIIFGTSAFVDVGGLVASTADISNDNFMAGNFDFNIASPDANASIINEGLITVADTGLAALVAPTVRNTGIISANLGTVGLAGARTFTLDFYGDGLFSFDTGAEVVAAPADGGALVENTGTISATGGRIFVTAMAAENVINNVINLDGIVEANSVGIVNGTIILSGGDTGGVFVTGDVLAMGDDGGETGGSITILGEDITLAGGSLVSVSGDAGGGTALIGGNYQGGGDLAHAQNVTVENDARVQADAITTGDGGTIILWADGTTTYEGAISARGGALSGDGGFVEVSGKEETLFLAGVNLGAANGQAGSLLIDPNNFTATAIVSAALEVTLDTGASVTIVADNDVFITNSIDGASSAVSGGAIAISSGRSTSISAGVTVSTNNGDISVIVNDDARNGANRSAGDAVFTNNGKLDSTGGNVTITNGALSPGDVGAFQLGSIVSGGGILNVNNTVDDITISTGTLEGGGGNINVTAAGIITVGDGAGTAIDASLGGDVFLDAGSDIIGGGGIIDMSGGGTLTLDAVGNVGGAPTGERIATSGNYTLQGTAGGRFHITNDAGADTTTVGGVSAGGNITIFYRGDALFSGPVVATGDVRFVGFSVASDTTITGSVIGDAILIEQANGIDIQNTITGNSIEITAYLFGFEISLNGTANVDLTNAELAFLNTSGTVTIGEDDFSGNVTVGAGTDISGLGYDLRLESNGSLIFDDGGTALTLDDTSGLTLIDDAIVGGGTMTDISFGGTSSGVLDVTANAGGVDLITSEVGTLDVAATSTINFANTGGGTLNVNSFVSANSSVDLTNTGDVVIETGTASGVNTMTFDITGDLTVGNGAGVAIDASAAGTDVIITASGDVLDGGGIINMSGGGTLTLDAGGAVGGSGAAIDTSSTANLFGAALDGDFYVSNSGAGTLSVENVSAAGAGTISNDIVITNTTTDISIGGTITADGDITIDSGDDILDGGGSLDLSGGTLNLSASGNIGAVGTAVSGSGAGFLNFTSGGTIDFDHTGNVTIATGSITSAGDIDLGIIGNITIGTTAGTAIDATGSTYDVTIGATGDIIDGGGIIEMTGGTLTLNASGDIGSTSDAIAASGAAFIDFASGGSIDFEHTGDVAIVTGSIVTGGDVDIDISGTLTIGTSAGTAVDATGGVYDVALSATGDIVDGGGVIDMSGGGTLTLDAVGNAGGSLDGQQIRVDGTFTVQGSAGGDFGIKNDGNGVTTTFGDVTAGGDIGLWVRGDAVYAGTITTTGDVRLLGYGLGSEMTITGSVTGDTVDLDINGGLDIQGLITANAIDIAPLAFNTTFSLNGSSTIDLTNAELALLNTTGTVTIGQENISGNLFVGAGTDLTGQSYDLRLESNGNISFDDTAVALAMASGATVTLAADAIVGGGTLIDISFGGTSSGVLDVTANAGSVNLITSEVGTLDVTATSTINFANSGGGTLNVNSFVSVNASVDLTNTGNVVIETGTASGNTMTFDITGDLTVGNGAGIAIDASAAGTDVTITASGNVTDGGGVIDMSGGGTLTFDAGGGVGASGAAIDTSSTANLTGSAADGGFFISNTGGTTMTVGDVSAAGAGTTTGDVEISNLNADLAIAGTITTDGTALFDAGSGDFSVAAAAAATASGTLTVEADAIDLLGTLTGGDIVLRPASALTIGIGDGTPGTFNLTNAEIALLGSTGTVTIGSATSDDVEINSADFTGATYDLTIAGFLFTFDDADAALTIAESATVILDAAGAINGGGTSDDIVFTNGNGSLGFEAVGNVVLDTIASTAAGTATGSIALDNTGDLEIGIVGAYTGLTAVGGSVAVTVASDLDVTSAISAAGDATFDAGTGNFSMTAAITSGGTATVIADSLHIGATLTGNDIELRAATAGRLVGINYTGTTFNLTEAEMQNLESTGTVTIGSTIASSILIGSVGTTDISGETYDLTLIGGALAVDDSSAGLLLNAGSSLTLDLSGTLTGGGTMTDFTWAGGTSNGIFDFDAIGAVTVSTSAVSTLDGTATGAISYVNTGPGQLNINSLVSTGSTVDVTNIGNVVVETGTLEAASDITMDVSGDITIGDNAGVAIDATGGGDVTLTATGNVIDGGGVIDMRGGGTLTLVAAGGVGSSTDAISTSGAYSLTGMATDGGFFISNGDIGEGSGFLVTVGDVSAAGAGTATGDIVITNNDGGIDIAGTLTTDGNATFDAGTDAFSVSGVGAVTASGTLTAIADTVDIVGTLSGADIVLQPDTLAQSIGLSNATGLFNLTNAEFNFLDTTGTVSVGAAGGSGAVGIGGSGTLALADNAFDLVIRGGDLTFDDGATAMTIRDGGHLTLDVGAITGGGTMLDIDYAGTSSGELVFDATGAVDLVTDGLGTLTGTATGSIDLVNTGALSIAHLEAGGATNIDNTGDTTIETGTLVAAGDVVLTITGTLTVGDASGVAIDASGGVYDITLDVSEDIVDGGGVIDMRGGGTLTFDAAGGVGSSTDAISTSGAFSLTGSAADGGFFISNGDLGEGSGFLVTVGDIDASGAGTATGDISITNTDGGIDIAGTLTTDGNATFDAGINEFSVSGAGAATASGMLTVIANTVDIAGTLTGADIVLRPETLTQTIGLSNTTGTFNLTNAELDLLDSSGTVTVGAAGGSGAVGIGGSGTLALADNAFDLVIRGGDLTFDDGATAMTIRDGGHLTLDVGSITGGGTMLDIDYAGTSSGELVFNATGAVDLVTDGLGTLTGTATGSIDLVNTGALSIAHLEAGGTTNIDNTGDTTIETGTLVAAGDVVLTITGTLTVGDASGVAIDASGGVFDITLDVSEDIIDADGIIDMSGGGTLTMDAGGAVGGGASLIETSGTFTLTGSAADGGFFVANAGGGTMTVGDVSAMGAGTATGSITIFNLHADLDISGTVTSDGGITFYAGTGDFAVLAGGAATASSSLIVIGNTVDIGGTLTGSSIILRPDTASTSIGLSNASGTFNLTNTEFDFLDTTGTVSVGAVSGTGDVHIGGAGTLELADNAYDLTITGGDLFFNDASTALRVDSGIDLKLNVSSIMGGGTMTDIAFVGTTTAKFRFDIAGGVDLATDGLGILSGTAGGSISFSNLGTLSVDHLEAGGTIDVINIGDATIETGTVVAGDTLTMDITGDLTLGDASGVAIDATGGMYDVILTASGDIIDAGGRIDLAGGALQLDAGGSVGSRVDLINTSGTTELSGSAGDGEFYVRNEGGTTVTVIGIFASSSGTASGDVGVINDDQDIHVSGAISADGLVELDAGTGGFSNAGAGTVTAADEVEIAADTIALAAAITGAEIFLHPNTLSQTVGLNDAQGAFNLSEAELQLLDATGWVVIGGDTATGSISIGSLGTIDLTGETYNLGLQGGDLTFDDGQTAIMMSAGSIFGMNVDSILGGGTEFDVSFPGGGTPDGTVVFLADGTVDLRMSAGTLAGSATGDIDIFNSGDLTIGEYTIGDPIGTVTGLVSSGSIDLTVASDLDVIEAVSADDEIVFYVGAGAFTNSGDGTVTSSTDGVEIYADTMNIGATISADYITLSPTTAGRTIGLGSVSGDFNLTDAEFALLSASEVFVGTATSGIITIGDVETIDLTAEGYDLWIEGGDNASFSDVRTGFSMAEDAVLAIEAASITGGGGTPDIIFESATGIVLFEAHAGAVTLNTQASTMAGTASGDITIDNTGDLEIADLGDFVGLESGGTITVEVHSDLTVTGAVTATGDVTLDANSGTFTNSGGGTVFAGGDVLVEADTVAIGATITGDNITLRPDTDTRSIGLNDSAGDFNLTEAELVLLESTSDVTIGQAGSGSGTITIGDIGTIDLSAEEYDLVLLGGDVAFANQGGTGTMVLALGSELLMDVGAITGGGGTDVIFGGTTGAVGFTSTGAVDFNMSGSTVAGTAIGDIDLDNIGDLEVGTVRGIDGLGSGGSVTVEVHSDLSVTEAVLAIGDASFDANMGEFSNSGGGFITAGGDVLVEADTVALGAAISGANITLRPDSIAQTVGLNDASGMFNLTNAELDFLSSTGMLTIGRVGGTSDVFVGSLGTVDLSDELFDLTLYGGALMFADSDPALLLHESSTAIIDVASIAGGGTFTDIEFVDGHGDLAIDVMDSALFTMDGSTLAGIVGDSLEGTNVGDLTIAAVAGYTGLTVGTTTKFDATGGSLTMVENFTGGDDTTLQAFGDLTLAGGDLDVDSGTFVVALISDTGMIFSTGNAVLLSDGELWLDAATGVNLDTVGSGTMTFTLAGETDTGDFDIENTVGGNVLVGSVTGFGSGLTVIALPGAGGDDLLLSNLGHGGSIVISSDVTGSDNIGVLADGAVTVSAGATVDASRGGFLALGSKSATITIDGVIDGTGPGNVIIIGDLGIDGTGKILMASNGLGLMTETGDIDVTTQGLDGETFSLAASAEMSGDVTVTNTGSGNILLDEVSVSDLADTGISGTVTDVTTPDGDIRIHNAAVGAGNGELTVSDGFEVGALAVTSSGNVTFISDTAGITIGMGATVLGTISVSFSAATDIAIGDSAEITSGGPLSMTAGGTISTGDMSELTSMGDMLLDAVDDITIGSTATVGAGGALTVTSSGGGIMTGKDSSLTGVTGVAFSASDDIDIGDGAFVGSGGLLAATAGGTITTGMSSALDADGSLILDAGKDIAIGMSATVNAEFEILAEAADGSIMVGDSASLTGGSGGFGGIGFLASDEIVIGDDVYLFADRNLEVEAGTTLTLGTASMVLSGDDALFMAGEDFYLGNSATMSAEVALGVEAGGTLMTGKDSTVTAGFGGAATSATGLVIFEVGGDLVIGEGAEVTGGVGILLASSGGTITAGADSLLAADAGIGLIAASDIDIGSTATVTSGGILVLGSGGTITAGMSSTITGAIFAIFNAADDIDIGVNAFVGSPDVALMAGADITTDVGSTVRGGATILFDAGGDITTNGTTDASAAGVEVALLAGGTITDGGNTFLFSDGSLRAEAGGDIDLTLSGTAGSTITAALSAGGSVDFFLRDAGDLTIDQVMIGGGTTTGVTAADGYVDIDVEDGLLTVNADISALESTGNSIVTLAVSGSDVMLTADDMEIFSTVSATGDIFVDPYTDGRGIALNDPTTATLNLTNAEIAFLSTPNKVEFGRANAGDIYIGGSGSLDLTTTNWADVRFLTDSMISITSGVESEDINALFDGDVVLTGATVIDTVNGGTGGDVRVTGTIEGATSGGQSLTITAGVADIDFEQAAGQVTPLGALALSGNDITVTDITTVGTQSFTATGEITFGSSYITNGFAFSLTGGLTLADNVLIDTSVGAGTGADISIDDVTNDGNTFTLDAGNDGAITLGTWTNVAPFAGMGTLRIIDSDTTTISGAVNGDTLEVVDTTTSISLLGDVTLDTLTFAAAPYDVIITGSNVFFVGQVMFNNTGTTTLGDSAGDIFTFTGGVDATSGSVNVAGSFTFGGAGVAASFLSLSDDTSFTTTGGTMLLGAVFGNGNVFTLDAGNTGDITLGSFTNPTGTGTLNVINADEVEITGEVMAGTVDFDTAQTSVSLLGMLTADNLFVGAGNYIFSLYGGALVTNFVDFLNSGGVNIGDEDTDVSIFQSGFESTASDTTAAGLIQSEGGPFTFADLLLTADLTIDSTLNTAAGGAINFNGMINSAPSTGFDLSVLAGNASTATFTGNVGDIDPLGSLQVSALEIVLHDVSTVGEQIYNALNASGGLGQVQLNSTYQTQGADFTLTGNVDIADDATVDTTWGGAYTMGDIFFGGAGGAITFQLDTGTLNLISGESTLVNALFAGSLAETNSVEIWARDNIGLAGGTLGNDLMLHAGAFDGNLNANAGGNIVINGTTTIGDFTDMTASGDVTFLNVFNTYALRIQLDGLASSTSLSPVNIEEDFDIGGLTLGLGESKLVGTVRGNDSSQASLLGNQIELERRDVFLFNDCIVEVGCLNIEPSAIVIPVFDPVIYLYERDGTVHELRYSDLPNTEIWYGLGGAPDIWEERLGTSDDDENEEEE